MIRTLTLVSFLALSAPAIGQEIADASPPPHIQSALDDGGDLVTVDVLGMVCDFCATALTKTFGRRDEVTAVHVNLDAKTLSLVLAAGAHLDDDTIASLTERSGYRVDAIHRAEEDGDARDAS